MTTTPLKVHMRAELKEFALKHVEARPERQRLDAAYTAAAKPVRAAIDAEFPPKDMKVLERYGVARRDLCINRHVGRDDTRFTFRDDDKLAPVLPSYGGCQSRMFLFDAETQAKLAEWHLAKAAYETAVTKKRDDYYRLVDSARTFEEIVALWPAVEVFRSRFCQPSQAVASLTAEAIARIKADNAGAEIAAAP